MTPRVPAEPDGKRQHVVETLNSIDMGTSVLLDAQRSALLSIGLASLSQSNAVTAAFQQHYNFERPHQGLSCGNRPPGTAFPILASLPPLPATVDPDSWLSQLDGLHLERKVNRHGMVSIDLKHSYISSQLVGQHVVLHKVIFRLPVWLKPDHLQ